MAETALWAELTKWCVWCVMAYVWKECLTVCGAELECFRSGAAARPVYGVFRHVYDRARYVVLEDTRGGV